MTAREEIKRLLIQINVLRNLRFEPGITKTRSFQLQTKIDELDDRIEKYMIIKSVCEKGMKK